MTLEIVHGQPENLEAARQLADLAEGLLDDGTIYLGYPVLATADDRVEIDALLVSRSHGLIAFRFADALPSSEEDWERLSREQDRIYNALESHLSRHDTLRRGREFAVAIGTVTVFAADAGEPPIASDSVFASFDQLPSFIQQRGGLDPEVYRALEAALQRVTTIRPAKRRAEVKSENSRGATMKVIERGIANLDFWQKKAAIETPDGPQRIRGLAGSGKTIVLALKAALLHSQNEPWNIAVTFWSQSLYQQFEDLIKRFSFAHMDDLPDPERLAILHAWGSRSREGIYTRLADALGVPPVNFGAAEQKYGRDGAFAGVCQELLTAAQEQEPIEPIFDAVLIDEAQDLPPAFFQLVHMFTKDPKRVVWAYDELQKLDESEMASVAELFGTTATGEPVVNITNRDNEPRRDIVLPVCYRNTPWAIATAHAIGFGIYRPAGLVQHFENPQLWEEIGYQRDAGALQLGAYVELERSPLSSPAYFDRVSSDDAVILRSDFMDEAAQDRWVAEQILRDLDPGELELDDILVVLPSAYTSKRRYARLASVLDDHGIASHLVGVNSGRDEVFVRGSVAVAHIFRAKGNEAPMVYVVDAQYAGSPFNEVSRRNTIFTAITRSKAWVRVCGYGPTMEGIAAEVEAVRSADFKLKFTIPTADEMAEMRAVNADLGADGTSARGLMTLEQLADAFERKEISADQLPPKLVRQLMEHLNQIRLPNDDA